MEISSGKIIAGLVIVALLAVGGLAITNGALDVCKLAGINCPGTEVNDTSQANVNQPYPGFQQPSQPAAQQPSNPIVYNQYIQQPTPALNQPTQAATGSLPIETLKVKVQDKYTMAAPGVATQVHFYTTGADVSDPNVLPIDSISVGTDGTGNTTNMVIQTTTNYDVYFNGTSAFYDELVSGWKINYNPDRGVGFLQMGVNPFYAAVNIGTIAAVDSLPEVQDNGTCIIDVSTNTINYSVGGCTGSAWFKMDLGNAESNSELKDLVLCFRDSDGDMEGDEISALTASYVSGSTAIKVPGTLGGYWKEGMGTSGKRCILIAKEVGSSVKSRYEFTATVNEGNFALGEEFEISQDDLGDVAKKEYPSWDAKASTVTLTVQRGA